MMPKRDRVTRAREWLKANDPTWVDTAQPDHVALSRYRRMVKQRKVKATP